MTVASRLRVFVDANRQRVVDLRQRLGREFDVHDVAEHLDDFTGGSHDFYPFLSRSASAPPTISRSSLVIAAWRALFI